MRSKKREWYSGASAYQAGNYTVVKYPESKYWTIYMDGKESPVDAFRTKKAALDQIVRYPDYVPANR